MSQIEFASVDELMARFKTACELKQAVDRPRIEEKLLAWWGRISSTPMRVRFADTASDQMTAAWDARDARDAWAAWAAWAARAARDAWAAWAARAARAARDARDARAAWAARAARDAWDARAARDAWDVSWCSIVVIGASERADGETYARWMPFFEAFEAGAFSICIAETELVVGVLPNFVKVDAQRRLHAESGPAFSWIEDVREFYWHGARVPAHVIDEPSKITVEEIDETINAEVRRVMIERYGAQKYLLDSGAAAVNQDGYGILYRKEFRNDEPLAMVHVLNSTPEPDGVLTREDAERTFGAEAVAKCLTYASSQGIDCTAPRFKTYFIRVPPTIKTAHEGVAWTFGLTPKQYAPLAQT